MKKAIAWLWEGMKHWCQIGPQSTLVDSVQFFLIPTAICGAVIGIVFTWIYSQSPIAGYYWLIGIAGAVLVWLVLLVFLKFGRKKN